MSEIRKLGEVVIVNDNRDPLVPGDVSVFRTELDACRYLEPWWVEEGGGLALNAKGERLDFGVSEDGLRVVVAARTPLPEGQGIAVRFLRARAEAVCAARRKRNTPSRGVRAENGLMQEPPSDLEGLITYAGYDT
jgi:hypothetical protein